jgi:peroxiredoxin
MAQLRQAYDEFRERDAEIIVVGPEDRESFARYWQNEDLPFVGIPDPTHTVLKRYGQEVNMFKLGRMPAQVIVDKSGQARYVHYGHSMSDIPSNAELLGLLDEINQEHNSNRHDGRPTATQAV